jgi:hypothetical protein
MMHFISRVIGVGLLLIAVVALVVDATKTLGANGVVVITPLDAQWQQLSPASLEWVKQSASAKFGPAVWNEMMLPVLHLPAWAIFGALGVLFYWAGQRRRQEQIYIN